MTADLTTALIGVGGVAIGATGQYIIARLNRASALRADRHKAINDFIESVQRARVLTSTFPIFGPIPEHKEIAHKTQLIVAEVWFRLGCIEVVCRPTFHEVAAQYANAVEELTLATVIDGLMSEEAVRGKYKSRVIREPHGKPEKLELGFECQHEPEYEALAAIERTFFSAARKELLYSGYSRLRSFFWCYYS